MKESRFRVFYKINGRPLYKDIMALSIDEPYILTRLEYFEGKGVEIIAIVKQ